MCPPTKPRPIDQEDELGELLLVDAALAAVAHGDHRADVDAERHQRAERLDGRRVARVDELADEAGCASRKESGSSGDVDVRDQRAQRRFLAGMGHGDAVLAGAGGVDQPSRAARRSAFAHNPVPVRCDARPLFARLRLPGRLPVRRHGPPRRGGRALRPRRGRLLRLALRARSRSPAWPRAAPTSPASSAGAPIVSTRYLGRRSAASSAWAASSARPSRATCPRSGSATPRPSCSSRPPTWATSPARRVAAPPRPVVDRCCEARQRCRRSGAADLAEPLVVHSNRERRDLHDVILASCYIPVAPRGRDAARRRAPRRRRARGQHAARRARRPRRRPRSPS